MNCKLYLIIALILKATVLVVSGQDQSFVFKHISIEDGLSQSTVNAIYQDSQGFIWFGTENGLNKYNGVDFKIFKNSPINKNTLSHNWIWDIAEDRHGNLWIATWNGLNKYSRSTGKYKRYFPQNGDSNSLSATMPNCLLLDRSGNLWIGTWGGGLNLYREQTDDFKTYLSNDDDPNSLNNDFIRALYEDSDGIIWIGTWEGGLNKYNASRDNFTNYITQSDPSNYISGNLVSSISDGPDGHLWIGTFQNGISIFDKKSNRFISIDHSVYDFLEDKSITSVIMDKDSMMWIGTQNDGLFIFDKDRNEFHQIMKNSKESKGIKSNLINALYLDNAGTIYIGNSGVSLFNRSMVRIKHYKQASNKISGLNDAIVLAFAEQDNGNLWIGTANGGLNFMDLQNDVFKSFIHSNAKNSISNNYVRILEYDEYENLWIGSYGGGLDRYDLTEKRFENINDIYSYHPFNKGLRITSLNYDTDYLWIGTEANGIFKYDYLRDTITKLQIEYNDTLQIGSICVSVFHKDMSGNLWIGGWGGGMSVLKKNGHKLSRYVHDEHNHKSLSSNIINCIFEDENGTLWAGTNQGLNKLVSHKSDAFNSFDEEFIAYFQKDGLPNEVIYSIEGDFNGNLWIGTNNGLTMFNIENEEFTIFNVLDGLQGTEFNAKSSLRLSDGTMVFGGINGFNLFHPDEIMTDTYQPPVLLTKLQILGEEINLDSLRSNGNDLILPYDRNFLSIEFAALEFVAPQKIQYSYIMDGVDQQYIDSEGRRFANYTNLDPGSYVFKLRNTNRDGIWNDLERYLQITIRPPYWLTWWFILSAAIFIVSATYLAYRFRVNRLLEIERLRSRIAGDLHDDIGSSLTKISLYSELIKEGAGEKSKTFYLKDISALSREVIGSMSDIVWSIDTRHDSMQDLLDRIKEFAISVCTPKNISVFFKIKIAHSNKSLKPIYRQNIFLIFKEAINNIIKHAKADIINVNISQSGTSFTMEIQDNGTGVDMSKVKDTGHGLVNMQTRAKRFGAILNYRNNNGFTVILKCNHFR